MKDFDYYRNVPVEYPDRAAIKAKHLATVGVMRLTERERKAATTYAISDAVSEYDAAMKAYRAAEAVLEAEFWADCRGDLGYSEWLGEDGISAIESRAYEEGHAHGYSEIYCHLCDLVPMVERCVKSAKGKVAA